MAKKLSEIDIFDCKDFLRVDFDDDDFFIEMALDCAKSYICNYCKRTIEDLDNIPEVCMAALIITAHFYDNRSLETDNENINYTIDKILGCHKFYMSDKQLGE